MMTAMTWMSVASSFLGTKEITGPLNESVIVGWLEQLKAWWRDDETPWCGVFVAAVMYRVGLPYPKLYMRAREWLKWGAVVSKPVYGCIGIFERGGGGHVGFIVGLDAEGNPWVLGGNQSNSVSIMKVSKNRVLGYRVPHLFSFASAMKPPLLTSASDFSVNEA